MSQMRPRITGESMGKTLVICLVLVTHLHAKSITLSSSDRPISTSTSADIVDSTSVLADSTTPSSTFNIEKELAKIETTCLTHQEHEELSGDMLKYTMARYVNLFLVRDVQEAIGLTELRAVLGFAPPGPWTHYKKPSEEEIAAAPTIEAYYVLREPRSEALSLDSTFFHEKNFPPAIAFLDKRVPAIRAIYRRKFEEIRSRPDAAETIDRKEVDRMIDEYGQIKDRVFRAIFKMFNNHDMYRMIRDPSRCNSCSCW